MKDFLTKVDDSDTSAGFVDAEDFNSAFEELENAVTPFQALNLADSKQLIKSIDIASKATRYVDTGTANTILLSRGATSETNETLFNGMTLMFTPAEANTGATTLKVKTLLAKSLKYLGVALEADFLQTDSVYIATYDLGNDWFECDLIVNKAVVDTFAKLVSPALTGTPTAPTAPNGTNTAQLATTAFAYGLVSKTASGYVKLPNGLIIQWGTGTGSGAGVTATFPIVFPNSLIAVIPSISTGNARIVSYSGTSPNAVLIHTYLSDGSSAGEPFKYIAIGH